MVAWDKFKRALRVFRQADPFAIVSGSQQTIDPALVLSAQRFHVGLRREDKLGLYNSIYYGVGVCRAGVDNLTRMINTPIIPKSGNPDVDRRTLQIWDELNCGEKNEMLIRQGNIFGYSLAEWVSDDMQTMDKLHVPQSWEMRFVADKYANITDVIQLAGTVYSIGDPRRRIPASKYIIYQRDKVSDTDYYGSSLYESIVENVEALCQTMRAQLSVMLSIGKPRFVVTIDNMGVTEEEYRKRLDLVTKRLDDLADPESTNLALPPADVKVIGAERYGARFADELANILSMILSGMSLPAELLNIEIKRSGGAESGVRQKMLALQSMITNQQRSLAAAWNKSFFQIVQRMERMPVAPKIEFSRTRILDELQVEKAREARRVNDLHDLATGLIDEQTYSQRQGVLTPDDLAALTEIKGRLRESYSLDGKGISNSETNAVSNTKETDERASNNNTG